MPRRLWIVPAVLLFLLASFELARYLTASGAERGDVVELLRDQGRGDVAGMLEQLDGCEQDPACVALVRRNARTFRTPGGVKVLRLESDVSYKLKSTIGPTRVAWTADEDLGRTVVQCVTVEKRWSFVHGARVSLRGISPRIGNEASCP